MSTKDAITQKARIKVLLADENKRRVNDLYDILSQDSSLEAVRLEPGHSLIDAVSHHKPDVVLVDISRPDRDALDSVRALSSSGQRRPVALFVDEDDPPLMEAAFEAGVCSYNVVDTPPTDVKPLLRAAIGLYAHFQKTRFELEEAQTEISNRKMVDQAKRLLMRSERINEAEAHRRLQRQAMRQSRRLVDVARELVQTLAGKA